MAINQQGSVGAKTTPKGITNNLFNQADPSKYSSLADFIKEVNAPDVRAQLVKSFGDQGISGFLEMTGAVTSAGTADEVTYWEEARLHQAQTVVTTATTTAAKTVTFAAGLADAAGTDDVSALILRVGDIVLLPGGERCYVSATTPADGAFTLKTVLDANFAAFATGTWEFPVIGNMYKQGDEQPGRFLESNVVRRQNPYAIVKESYEVSGSQATNIGYIDVGNGDYRWYLKGEMDTRQRFLDKREMMMLLGQKATSTAVKTTAGIAGTEGYFSALEDRGLVNSGGINTVAELDLLLKEMDKNGCPSEYAVYSNTAQFLKFDDMISGSGAQVGLAASYGAFNNNKDMAVNLGFQSFGRGGYTFHKHNWKLLNDPTLLGQAGLATNVVSGAMIPIANVTDAKTGNKAPALEMNYKSANGYSRELEHWVTGGGVLGFKTNTKDSASFNYRSESCLVTRAANQHVLIKAA
tara:strand:- start:31818 stop:33218 length:1401 start_codon:yes stop_codon:yes gene_type:complete